MQVGAGASFDRPEAVSESELVRLFSTPCGSQASVPLRLAVRGLFRWFCVFGAIPCGNRCRCGTIVFQDVFLGIVP